jgi:NAD(P)H-hydrate epimerase
MLEEEAFRRLMPRIPDDAHKNVRGHLAVFAGSVGTTGAAWLCATAAGRARAGLVTAFLSRDVYPVLAAKFSSIMAKPWDGPQGGAGFEPARFSGLLVGPGWGLTDERLAWLEYLLSCRLPGVIDADGLGLLARLRERGGLSLGGKWVLTPHPGEFSRLSGESREEVVDDPVRHALSLAERLDAVVVLKGVCTCVAGAAGRYWVYDGMNPALATGGSGDVLAGIIAAAIAGGMNPLDAALAGVSLHGRVGRIARAREGWFLAEDLLPLVSHVLGKDE